MGHWFGHSHNSGQNILAVWFVIVRNRNCLCIYHSYLHILLPQRSSQSLFFSSHFYFIKSILCKHFLLCWPQKAEDIHGHWDRKAHNFIMLVTSVYLSIFSVTLRYSRTCLYSLWYWFLARRACYHINTTVYSWLFKIHCFLKKYLVLSLIIIV